eukprot:scaffold60212_cov21-Tisochrysis_lutea.AAC.1
MEVSQDTAEFKDEEIEDGKRLQASAFMHAKTRNGGGTAVVADNVAVGVTDSPTDCAAAGAADGAGNTSPAVHAAPGVRAAAAAPFCACSPTACVVGGDALGAC